KESREEMKVAFEELRPRLRDSTEKLKDKLRGDLTEEQIEKFSKYLRPPTSRDRFKGGPSKRSPGSRGDDLTRRGPRSREHRRPENKVEVDPILEKPIN
ncbi:MAG TPA: hypothetical protein DGJ56_07830, partial [Verrucomicrobiales bacterium]|nr:hypothetical protein [Verrucomicrobiales bacterium]